ncbi:hypothetical protein LSCM1_08034 [Leishmania martiniquensis]|uniref:FAD-binding domain-containing protein n=1 Tax=Leishmania martiniquensis TaxID=1580590 RepID=A0A836I2E2_9TRYP|nr:hypothetical protein LSCM1_08034 [Leishmania martiniquensis]
MLRCNLSALAPSLAAAQAHEVIVSGGGLVGAAMMASLQQLRSHLHRSSVSQAGGSVASLLSSQLARLMLVDSGRRPVYDASDVMHKLRAVSITPVSSKIMDSLGVWDRLTTKHPFYRIAVRHEQANSPFLGAGGRSSSFFMTAVLGDSTSREPLLDFTDLRKPVGFMCFNAELNSCMMDVVEAQQRALVGNETAHDTLYFGAHLEEVHIPNQDTLAGPWGSARLIAGEADIEVSFGLLLGCEGRNSSLRSVLSAPSLQHDYAQTAFVCTARLEKADDSNVCCFQNFFRDGKIIALLPTSEDTANIVLSTTPQHARELLASTQEDLITELNRRLCAFAPNDIPKIVEVPQTTTPDGKIRRAQASFPLKLNVTTTPYAPRAILLGDAAHSIHPFAGQGLNLGIYDLCALTSVLEQAIRSGQDIGSSVAVGQLFAGHMLSHTAPVIAGMEVVQKLAHCTPGLASAGMKALNTVPVLSALAKDAIMQVSSGALFAAQHDCFLLR